MDNDILAALQNLAGGLKELSLSTAIQDANQQVQQIKASQAEYADKHNALQAISQNLVSRMFQSGASAQAIQAAQATYGPKQFASADQMILEGVSSGDKGLEQAGIRARDESSKTRLAEIKAAYAAAAANDPEKKERARQAAVEAAGKAMASYSAASLAEKQRNGAYGTAAKMVGMANALEALAGPVADSIEKANEIPAQQVYEMAASAAVMIKRGGVATQEDIKHFVQNTLGMGWSKFQNALNTGGQVKVEGANAGSQVRMYLESARRERAQAQIEMADTLDRIVNAHSMILSISPEVKERWLSTVAKDYGVTPEDLVVDEKSGSVRPKHMIQRDKMLREVPALLTRVYGNPKTPESQAILKKLGIDPNKTTLPQAISDVRYKVQVGHIR